MGGSREEGEEETKSMPHAPVTKKVKKDNQIPFVASMGVFLEIPQRK